MPASRKSTTAKRAAPVKKATAKVEQVDDSPPDGGLVGEPEVLPERLPGLYLDDVEAINAEQRRAGSEGRKPDYDGLGFTDQQVASAFSVN